MRDSLTSMREINVDSYVINVRGRFSEEVVDYLKLSVKNLIVTRLESPIGWFYDTSRIVQYIKTNYVLLWLEDQICMNPKSVNEVVCDMLSVNADILMYTYWCNGTFLKRYLAVEKNYLKNISWFDHTFTTQQKINEDPRSIASYIIAYPSIIKTELFLKLINYGGDCGPYSHMTPFNFEKEPNDTQWLPLRRAAPIEELFAPIDDDHYCPGSSLQSRGLYPKRVGRESYAVSGAKLIDRVIRLLSINFEKINNLKKILYLTAIIRWRHKLDYIKSIIKSTTYHNLPNCNYQLMDYIYKIAKNDAKILEFAKIPHTEFWGDKNVQLTSIFYDRAFFDSYPKDSLVNSSVKVILIEPEIDFEFSAQYKNSGGYSFEKYIRGIDIVDNGVLDLIVVWGDEFNCIFNESIVFDLLRKLKFNGYLIINNIDQLMIEPIRKKISSRFVTQVFSGAGEGSLKIINGLIVTYKWQHVL